MQSAVDIVLSSPHPDNKVAASLFNETTTLSQTNFWPQIILDKLGTAIRIGDSSGTVHAEVNCLLHFPEKTQGAEIAITDPCCPNCAKNISESGIKTVYIDHKGFQKDFAARRGEEFKNMSLNILAHAGISIYEINRKEQSVSVIHEPEKDYVPAEDNPIEILPRLDLTIPTKDDLKKLIQSVTVKHPFWGCALAVNDDGKIFSLIASTHTAIGFLEEDFTNQQKTEIHPYPQNPEKKYNYHLTPLNRLLFGATRHNLHLIDGMVWTSLIPNARELVNFVGAGFSKLNIGEKKPYAKESALEGLLTLENSGIIEVTTL